VLPFNGKRAKRKTPGINRLVAHAICNSSLVVYCFEASSLDHQRVIACRLFVALVLLSQRCCVMRVFIRSQLQLKDQRLDGGGRSTTILIVVVLNNSTAARNKCSGTTTNKDKAYLAITYYATCNRSSTCSTPNVHCWQLFSVLYCHFTVSFPAFLCLLTPRRQSLC